MKTVGILLVGHGSSKKYNYELVNNIAARIAETNPDFKVRCAYMWMSDPAIPEALDRFREDDIDSIVVLPLFLTRGVHIDEDIPRILNLPRGEKKGIFHLVSREIPLILADPIGQNPVLADLMEDNAQKALALI
jgi:sirohydrochlorin cobaltochelatase